MKAITAQQCIDFGLEALANTSLYAPFYQAVASPFAYDLEVGYAWSWHGDDGTRHLYRFLCDEAHQIIYLRVFSLEYGIWNPILSKNKFY